ncbi:MAG: hypothetical protein ACQEW8_12595 [Actinomycetota bacterium]
MVDHEQQRARYISNAEGAPPVPPPGGYRGARRARPDSVVTIGVPASVSAAGEPASTEAPRTANAIGWVALVGAILFAVTLLGAMLAGGTDLLYGVTILTLQLVLVATIVAALVTARGRTLGAIALIITLLLNVGTVGAMSALQTSAAGNYDGAKSEEQRHAEAFPGMKDVSSEQVLAQSSLEEIRDSSDAMLADIRDALSAEFGYTWSEGSDEALRPERNGYGGESMLVQYTSTTWATNEPIQDYDRKLAVMDVIDRVIAEHGMWGIISLNDASSGLDPGMLEQLYGTDDPRTQPTWEWYSDDFPEPRRFYATIHDTSNDPTGEFLESREAQSARTGEPVEGLKILVIAPELLSEDDRDEFERLLPEYPGF